LLKWEAQGADEQALNWGKIIDEPAYRYSNFKAVFCLQVPVHACVVYSILYMVGTHGLHARSSAHGGHGI